MMKRILEKFVEKLLAVLLEKLETILNMDINEDGHIGKPPR